MNAQRILSAICGLAIGLAVTCSASGQVVKNSATFPPPGGKFKAKNDLTFEGLKTKLKGNVLVIGDLNSFEYKKGPSGLKKTVDAKLKGKKTKGTSDKKPFSLKGRMQKKVFGRTDPKQTGKFDMEIKESKFQDISAPGEAILVSLTASGADARVEIREVDNGQFLFDSFFDVFAELSLNGGDPVPGDGPARFRLVPEPASVAMLALGLMGLAVNARRHIKRGVI